MTHISVNSWVKRFEAEGIKGLETPPGRGRKLIMDCSDEEAVLIKELCPIWEKRGLFLFFLPPYSPHLNIAESLWRILKGKWLRPVDYFSTDSVPYATNRALAALGSELSINFAYEA